MPPGLVCGAGYPAGMPDLSPALNVQQGYLVHTPSMLQEGVVGGPRPAGLDRAH